MLLDRDPTCCTNRSLEDCLSHVEHGASPLRGLLKAARSMFDVISVISESPYRKQSSSDLLMSVETMAMRKKFLPAGEQR